MRRVLIWIARIAILSAAESAGIEYYFAEQEPPIVCMTELEAARFNLDYMRAIDLERHE